VADHAGYGPAFTLIASSALVVAVLLVTLVPETARPHPDPRPEGNVASPDGRGRPQAAPAGKDG